MKNKNIQSVVFLKNKGWTERKAQKYLIDNNYKTSFYGKGVDKKFDNQLRYRQIAPKFKNYFTVKKKNGILFIIGI